MRPYQPAILLLPADAPSADSMTPAQTALFAFAVGVIVLNLTALQPLVGVIGPALGMPASLYGLLPMATLLGYAAGLVLLVPLADLFENRRLVLAMLAAYVIALCAAALAPNAASFLVAAFAVGAAMSCVQVLVPLAASLTHESRRGRVVGNVMSGIMIGILLSRPLSSLSADALGWRGAFLASSLIIVALIVLLSRALPRRQPRAGMTYSALIGSLWTLVREERVLRLRASSAALAFAAFSVFWATVALCLAKPPFAFGAHGIAAFALAGVGGAIAAPLAGRLGDRGWTRPTLVVAHFSVIAAMGVAALSVAHAAEAPKLALAGLVLAALLLDIGVVGDQTLGRRAVNMIRPEARGRINGLFTGLFFIGGAFASALTGLAWTLGGWNLVCALAAVFACGALAISLTTLRDSSLG